MIRNATHLLRGFCACGHWSRAGGPGTVVALTIEIVVFFEDRPTPGAVNYLAIINNL